MSAPRQSGARQPTDTRSYLLLPSNAINATLYDKLNYNFRRDIAPVSELSLEPEVVVVNPSVPAKTVPVGNFCIWQRALPRSVFSLSACLATARGRRRREQSGLSFRSRRAVRPTCLPA